MMRTPQKNASMILYNANLSPNALRVAGRMPPVGEITEKTEEDFRSNRRPIELIASPACQLSQISDR